LQDLLFAAGEADEYWRRNYRSLRVVPKDDPVVALLKLYPAASTRDVLEVGCANGYRLAHFGAQHGWQGGRWVGVDPSAAAISAGRNAWPQLGLWRSTAAQLDVRDKPFGLVICHFVLHWVDRGSLYESVAALDGAVKLGGHLVIGDFYPEEPQRVQYKHAAKIGTYKLDYAALFLASACYEAVGELVYHHETREIGPCEPEHRAVVTLLRKRDGYKRVASPV